MLSLCSLNSVTFVDCKCGIPQEEPEYPVHHSSGHFKISAQSVSHFTYCLELC